MHRKQRKGQVNPERLPQLLEVTGISSDSLACSLLSFLSTHSFPSPQAKFNFSSFIS